MKYSMLKSMRDICARQWSRLEVDVPGPRGKGWRRTHSFVDTRDMDESWRRDMDVGCEHMMEESFVHGHDVHLDAKAICSIQYGRYNTREQHIQYNTVNITHSIQYSHYL